MRLDKTVFLREMAVLAELYNRPQLSDPLVARYYEYLSRRLDTPAFERACRTIFEQDQFWPPPARFIDAARGGNQKELAEAAWGEILQAAQRGQPPALSTLPPATRAALAAAPYREIQYADSEPKLARLKRQFTTAYAAAIETPPAASPALEAPEDEPDVLALFGMTKDDE